jgi:hypothetical protein
MKGFDEDYVDLSLYGTHQIDFLKYLLKGFDPKAKPPTQELGARFIPLTTGAFTTTKFGLKRTDEILKAIINAATSNENLTILDDVPVEEIRNSDQVIDIISHKVPFACMRSPSIHKITTAMGMLSRVFIYNEIENTGSELRIRMFDPSSVPNYNAAWHLGIKIHDLEGIYSSRTNLLLPDPILLSGLIITSSNPIKPLKQGKYGNLVQVANSRAPQKRGIFDRNLPDTTPKEKQVGDK